MTSFIPTSRPEKSNQAKVWQEAVFNQIIRTIGIAGSLLFIAYMVVSYKISSPSQIFLYTVAYLFAMVAAFMLRIPMRYRVLMFTAIMYIIGILASLEKASVGDGRIWLMLSVIFAVAFLGREAGLFLTLIITITWSAIGYLFVTSAIPQPTPEQFSFSVWAGTSFTLFVAALVTVFTVSALFQNINRSIEKSNALIKHSEEQAKEVELQRQALERRSNALEASAKISRQLVSLTTRQEILDEITNLIRAYYATNSVAVFMLDENQELRLASCNGWNEEARPKSEYFLPLTKDIVGQALLEEKALSDKNSKAALDSILPKTQAYAAIPLRGRSEILGILVLQSEDSTAFGGEGLNIFQMLADQVAILLENAGLLIQRENALQAERRAYGEITQAAWSDFLKAREYGGYKRDKKGLTPVESKPYPPQEQNTTEDTMQIPIKIREKIIGYIDARKPKNRIWTASEKELLDILTSRLETSLDNARLHQDSQEKARREQIIAETSQHVRARLDIEGVLETAARELRKNLDVEKAEIWVNAEHLDLDLANEPQE